MSKNNEMGSMIYDTGKEQCLERRDIEYTLALVRKRITNYMRRTCKKCYLDRKDIEGLGHLLDLMEAHSIRKANYYRKIRL